MNICPVTLYGGSGIRLWSMSHGGYPKQYLKFIGERTLVQQTASRLHSIGNTAIPIVIINGGQRSLVAEQLYSVDAKPSAIVLGLVGCDTMSAVAITALLAQQTTPEVLLLVLPLDYVIEDDVAFGKLTTVATSVIKDNFLVTFSIKSIEPYTGYGYIRGGEVPVVVNGTHRVERLVEEPDAVTVVRLLEGGGYYWNGGIFMLKTAAYLDELRQRTSEVLRQAELTLNTTKRDADFVRLDAETFGASPKLSIDYVVMEKTAYAAVVTTVGLGWNDIGSWTALAEIASIDDNDDALFRNVPVEGTRNTYVRAEYHMVTVAGVSDLVIVETADVILVPHRDRAQNVKKIIKRLNNPGRHESVTHRKVLRP